MVIKSGSCSLGDAGVQLLVQASAMKRTVHHGFLQCLKTTRQRGSLLVRKRTEKLTVKEFLLLNAEESSIYFVAVLLFDNRYILNYAR